MAENIGQSYGEALDNHFRYGGETEGREVEASDKPSPRVEEVKRVANRTMQLADAMVSGTLAVGTAKDPEYIRDLLSNIPVGNLPKMGGPVNPAEVASGIIESAGNIAANHPNPTVAVLGLSAVAGVMGRGVIPRPDFRKIFGKRK